MTTPSAAAATSVHDTNPRGRFHPHWNNATPLAASGSTEEVEAGEAGASSTNVRAAATSVNEATVTAGNIIQEQFEHDPRWQYISAFEGRARHSHWNNGIGESTTPGGGDTDDESSQGSPDEEATASNNAHDEDEQCQMMMDSKPFPGIRKFFGRKSSSAARASDGTILITLGA
eukprot:CAMPEP_0172526678 /NCGR_PEP_ID=MMETSP1067-20121228/1537_1 /TAXON_ID=265564 ORGANISM="Thalassiosira punctigera, Strain Tpunct2005C2" /NCGR_SAMPLE_ID=MMETSP1067 /ASSEMBLY_ACC=CAM_ASM_000444 /LENGTH=173 /DNA_ID=CAMNT_0013310235 /DNA_START=192 /DNA_END=713 /DNA_ORIENTATION=-